MKIVEREAGDVLVLSVHGGGYRTRVVDASGGATQTVSRSTHPLGLVVRWHIHRGTKKILVNLEKAGMVLQPVNEVGYCLAFAAERGAVVKFFCGGNQIRNAVSADRGRSRDETV